MKHILLAGASQQHMQRKRANQRSERSEERELAIRRDTTGGSILILPEFPATGAGIAGAGA